MHFGPDLTRARTLLAVMRAGAAIHRSLQHQLAALGVRPRDVEVLQAIATKGAPSIAELARTLGVKRQSLWVLVDFLSGLELVSVDTALRDRRLRTVHVTDDGEVLLQEALKVLDDCERRFLGSMEASTRVDIWIDEARERVEARSSIVTLHTFFDRLSEDQTRHPD